MTAIETYALFGAPAVMFVTGVVAYLLTLPGCDRGGAPAE